MSEFPEDEATEQVVESRVNTPPPRHLGRNGLPGEEIEYEEWMESQLRIASKAAIELLRAPRHPNDKKHLSGVEIPAVPKEHEELVYHLLQVHNEGMYHAPESFSVAINSPLTRPILNEWIEHFGTLFNVMAKQAEMPYEQVAKLIHSFQMRLVEHTQHLRRIWEWNAQGKAEQISAGEIWETMEWKEPVVRTAHGIDYLRQSVFLPYVEGFGEDVHLLLDGVHSTRESLHARLTPIGWPMQCK